MKVNHARMKKTISLSQAQQLFAQERETIEEAFPGDIIGLNNPGTSHHSMSRFEGGQAGPTDECRH
jgi:peptide subunit release factor RF-3